METRLVNNIEGYIESKINEALNNISFEQKIQDKFNNSEIWKDAVAKFLQEKISKEGNIHSIDNKIEYKINKNELIINSTVIFNKPLKQITITIDKNSFPNMSDEQFDELGNNIEKYFGNKYGG